MKRYRIVMNKADLKGNPNFGESCPVQRAIQRRFPTLEVTCWHYSVTLDGIGYDLSAACAQFQTRAMNLKNMAAVRQMKPITFYIMEPS